MIPVFTRGINTKLTLNLETKCRNDTEPAQERFQPHPRIEITKSCEGRFLAIFLHSQDYVTDTLSVRRLILLLDSTSLLDYTCKAAISSPNYDLVIELTFK